MIARIWRTRIDECRAADYETFISCKSMPMFRSQHGFLGALFGRDGTERVVISLWRDRSSVGALARSPGYTRTVWELEATRMLAGATSVQVLQLDQVLITDPTALADQGE
jgi:heme-degrading monooxygenase HmoA